MTEQDRKAINDVLTAIQERLESLERQMELTRQSVLHLIGEGASDVIKAKGFVVVDDNGKHIASLCRNEAGAGTMMLSGNEDSVGVVLSTGIGGSSGLVLSDDKGNVRVILGVNKGGIPSLGLLNEKGNLLATLAIDPNNTPGLLLYDNKGNVRVVLGVDQAGVSELAMVEPTGSVRVSLGMDGGGTPWLTVYGPDEKPLFTVPQPGGNGC